MAFTQVKQAAAALATKMHSEGLSGPFVVLLTPADGDALEKALAAESKHESIAIVERGSGRECRIANVTFKWARGE